MTLTPRGPGLVDVIDNGRVLATIMWRAHGPITCLDCPRGSEGYWTINGLGHFHRAVHAFRAIVTARDLIRT